MVTCFTTKFAVVSGPPLEVFPARNFEQMIDIRRYPRERYWYCDYYISHLNICFYMVRKSNIFGTLKYFDFDLKLIVLLEIDI